METSALKPNNVVEINMNVSSSTSSSRGYRKFCEGDSCNLSSSKISSKDANERSTSMRKLLMAVVLCIIFLAVEVVGGIKANSLAMLSDAAHLLSDVATFAISLFSTWASGWEATPRQSYGFFRIEILGSLVSIQLIWLLSGILVYQAIVRIIHDTGEVEGSLMFAVSTLGLVMNIIMAVLLGHSHGHGHDHSHHDHDHDHDHNHQHDLEHEEHELFLTDESEVNKKPEGNMNVRSAYLHVLGDFIQSIGVMIGGAIIWYKPEWKVVDLMCTLVFSVIVLVTTINMLRNILDVLMESTPREIDANRLGKGLCEVEGVVAIHELHIWAITVGKVLLACHVTISPEADADKMLDRVVGYIRREYNITHVTIQMERQ